MLNDYDSVLCLREDRKRKNKKGTVRKRYTTKRHSYDGIMKGIVEKNDYSIFAQRNLFCHHLKYLLQQQQFLFVILDFHKCRSHRRTKAKCLGHSS